jgi:hypothetical protein
MRQLWPMRLLRNTRSPWRPVTAATAFRRAWISAAVGGGTATAGAGAPHLVKKGSPSTGIGKSRSASRRVDP